jgi:precorrin isomerase
MYKVFVNDKPLFLTNQVQKETDFKLFLLESVDIKKLIVKIFQNKIQKAFLYHPDEKLIMKTLRAKLPVEKAGGGLVYNKDGDVLFIFRNGKWDLPKGGMEKTETIEETAIREVEEETVTITTLQEFDPEQVDMFTVVLIGNSQSYYREGKLITPRGYYREKTTDATGIGQEIMINSFRTIEKELKNKNIPSDHKWALLHAIHTTADFEMENILHIDPLAVECLYKILNEGKVRTIITDVTMAAAGIRKGALERMGIGVKCYLGDERAAALAKEKGITRTQAGIRMAAEEHPEALYVFGNAPTALMELCDLIRKEKAHPCGIIAAPVGFVHVCESKHMVKPFSHIPKLIVEGRKGGSNLAATLVNAILTFDDAEQLKPGRDV